MKVHIWQLSKVYILRKFKRPINILVVSKEFGSQAKGDYYANLVKGGKKLNIFYAT